MASFTNPTRPNPAPGREFVPLKRHESGPMTVAETVN